MEQWLSADCNLLQMNTYSSWLGQKGNRLVHSVKYKNIRTFNCLRQQMFFAAYGDGDGDSDVNENSKKAIGLY